MPGDDQSSRTYDPTPKRREDFRKQGRIARARDAGGLMAVMAALGVLYSMRSALATTGRSLISETLGNLSAITNGDGGPVLSRAWGAFLSIAFPCALAAAVGSALAGVAQNGISFRLEALEIKPERLNPLNKLKELFSLKHAATETFIAIARLGLVGYVAYKALREELVPLVATGRSSPAEGLVVMLGGTMAVVMKVVGALALLAFADYGINRFKIGREMMMTLQELKEEMRQEDGDPKVKGRMRARARANARKRMMSDVKKADVVVANPTHVSVALRYSAKDNAPVVIAKGHDDVALQIRSIARKHGIPIVESRALARALDAEVPVGKAIPGAHFAAVAQILAFVFRLRKKSVA